MIDKLIIYKFKNAQLFNYKIILLYLNYLPFDSNEGSEIKIPKFNDLHYPL